MNRILISVCLVWAVISSGISQDFPCDFDIECEDINTDLVIDINIPANISVGDVFCASFDVTTFEYIISMQFDIFYDPSVLSIDCSNPANLSVGNCLPGLDPNIFNCTNGNIRLVYFNNNVEGVCCADGSQLFELCFTVIGEPGETAIIGMDCEEIGYGLGFTSTDICFTEPDCNVNTVNTVIDCPNLSIILGQCNPSSTANQDGSLNFSVCGGVEPYDWEVREGGTVIASGSGLVDGGDINSSIDVALGMLEFGGTYIIEITDDSGAMTTRVVQFLSSADGINIDPTVVMEPTCFDRQNGRIEITATGGQPDYQYFWSTNQFGTNRIQDLPVGNYSVTVEDNGGCTAEADFALELDTLKLDIEVMQPASCLGAEDGIIKLSATGGNPFTTSPDTYLFQNSNTPTDCFIINDAEGGELITLTVRDDPDGACIVEDTLRVPNNPGFEVVELVNSGVQCSGDRVDCIELLATLVTSITVTLLDEDGFMVTDPMITSTTIGGNIVKLANLPAGIFIVEVQAVAPASFSNCAVRYDLVITDPDPLVFEGDFIAPDCGGNPGSIQYTLSGGGGNFDVSLNGGAIPISQLIDLGNDMFDIINLDGGMYELTVEDDNGCQDTLNFDLPMAGTLPLQIDTLQNLACGGGDVGALLVRTLTVCNNCDYEWFDSDGNLLAGGNQLINLGEGCYTAVVTDNDQGCSNMITACLSEVDGIEFMESLNPPNCAGGTDGTIGIVITQGEQPITFEWENFPQVTGSVLGPIGAGTYCVTIMDANLCDIETCIVLEDPDALELTIEDIIDVECSGEATGQIIVTAINGFMDTDFFNYIVFDENGMEFTTASGDGQVTIDNLPAGNYSVIVTDGQCAALEETEFVINESDPILIDVDNVTMVTPSCFGVCDGQLSVSAIGGSGSGYSFMWVADGNMTNSASDLCGDIWYLIDIMDDLGCVTRDSIFLPQPDSLVAELNTNASVNLSCAADNTGVITVSTTGGTPDYDFQWPGDISTTNTANGLGIGVYTITVTDVNGCVDFLTHEITAPIPVVADIAIPLEPACFGEETLICINGASGGTGEGYMYSVNLGFNLPLDSCLTVIAGDYTINVFDGSGCGVDTTIVIGQPDPVLVDLGEDLIEVALGDSSTVLQASISAINPVTIDWTPMDQVNCVDPNCQIVNISPSQAQLFEVLVTDSDGCTATDNVQVIIGQERNVYVPNIFSPNGDGINDELSVFIGEGVRTIDYFGIFDRWGNLVYEMENVPAEAANTIQWDGLFKGEELNPAVFAYRATVTFIDNQPINFDGTITLVR